MNAYTIKRKFKILYNSIGKYWWKKPTIKSIDETINYIRERHCSVSRFGDGEFEMMLGYGNGFQSSNDELSHRLRQVIMMPVDNHIVCLPDIFGDLSMLNEKSLKYNTELMKKRRRQYLNLLDIDRTYYNTFFTRFYDMFAVKSNSCRWAEKNKEIWGGRYTYC